MYLSLVVDISNKRALLTIAKGYMTISGGPQLAETTTENADNKAVLTFPQGDMSNSGAPQLAVFFSER